MAIPRGHEDRGKHSRRDGLPQSRRCEAGKLVGTRCNHSSSVNARHSQGFKDFPNIIERSIVFSVKQPMNLEGSHEEEEVDRGNTEVT